MTVDWPTVSGDAASFRRLGSQILTSVWPTRFLGFGGFTKYQIHVREDAHGASRVKRLRATREGVSNFVPPVSNNLPTLILAVITDCRSHLPVVLPLR